MTELPTPQRWQPVGENAAAKTINGQFVHIDDYRTLERRIATLEQQLAELRGKVQEWAGHVERGYNNTAVRERITDEMRQAVHEPRGGGGRNESR